MEHETEYAPWKAFVRNMDFVRKRLAAYTRIDEDLDSNIYLVRRLNVNTNSRAGQPSRLRCACRGEWSLEKCPARVLHLILSAGVAIVTVMVGMYLFLQRGRLLATEVTVCEREHMISKLPQQTHQIPTGANRTTSSKRGSLQAGNLRKSDIPLVFLLWAEADHEDFQK